MNMVLILLCYCGDNLKSKITLKKNLFKSLQSDNITFYNVISNFLRCQNLSLASPIKQINKVQYRSTVLLRRIFLNTIYFVAKQIF